ncbi:hypothetical protein SEVIR_2G336401v4 [Setaria viridis]
MTPSLGANPTGHVTETARTDSPSRRAATWRALAVRWSRTEPVTGNVRRVVVSVPYESAIDDGAAIGPGPTLAIARSPPMLRVPPGLARDARVFCFPPDDWGSIVSSHHLRPPDDGGPLAGMLRACTCLPRRRDRGQWDTRIPTRSTPEWTGHTRVKGT